MITDKVAIEHDNKKRLSTGTRNAGRTEHRRPPMHMRERGGGRSRPEMHRESSSAPSVELPHTKFLGWRRGIATENMVSGQKVYGEDLVQIEGMEFRSWNPTRSKLAAALLKGMHIKLGEDLRILYLGVSSGTTASHVSDIVRNGIIYGVDFAPRVLREFVQLSETRKNLVPVFGNSSLPEEYDYLIPGEVDMIYQDVAQPNQVQILSKNAEMFLKKGGMAVLMIKARSISVARDPNSIFTEEIEKLKEAGFRILETRRLEPFEKDHLAVVLEYVGGARHPHRNQ